MNLKNFTKTENNRNLSKNAKTPTVKKESILKQAAVTKVKECPCRERRPLVKQREQTEPMKRKQVFAVGQTVEVLWNEKDLKGTNCTSYT